MFEIHSEKKNVQCSKAAIYLVLQYNEQQQAEMADKA